MKVLHIGSSNKFTTQLFSFLGETFDLGNHLFLSYQTQIAWPDKYKEHYVEKNGYRFFIHLLLKGIASDKIILHCLPTGRYLLFLLLQPWLLKKCWWVVWGGDLYLHEESHKTFRWYKNEVIRKIVIKRIGQLITYIEGDVALARQWYGAKGQYHECLMYPSNLYKEYDVPQKEHAIVNIQVGNSADPSNNHLEVFEKLIPYKDQDIKIFVPLSYGDQIYAKNIVEVGRRMFGNKFVPLTSFMPFEEYLKFLGQIDIAVFNHRRQQAMGNTITLLGLGKSVYIRSDTTQWKIFKKIDITIYDISKLNDKNKLLTKTLPDNIEKIKKYFCIQNLERQWSAIFNG